MQNAKKLKRMLFSQGGVKLPKNVTPEIRNYLGIEVIKEESSDWFFIARLPKNWKVKILIGEDGLVPMIFDSSWNARMKYEIHSDDKRSISKAKIVFFPRFYCEGHHNGKKCYAVLKDKMDPKFSMKVCESFINTFYGDPYEDLDFSCKNIAMGQLEVYFPECSVPWKWENNPLEQIKKSKHRYC